MKLFDNERKNLIKREAELYAYQGEDKIVSSEEMKQIILDQKTPDVMLNSKLPTLDRVLNGFVGGELIVVSGITGEGKSLICQTLTSNFDDNKTKSLWFSYEMVPKQFLKKFGDKMPLFYLPQELKSNTADWLEERIWEAKLKNNIEAVFIDHLHFLVDLARIGNASLEIGNIVRNIKKIALKHNIVIFLIAHTKKLQSDKDKKELNLGDIRDSSFIEQEADTVLYIWREDDDEFAKDRSILKVAKNRREGTKGVKIKLQLVGKNLMEISNIKEEEEIEKARKEQEDETNRGFYNNDNF